MQRLTFLVISVLAFWNCQWLLAQNLVVTASRTEATALCKRLNAIKRMPYQNEHVDDGVYNQIMADGPAVVPCLIGELTNETEMPDPRSEPRVKDFRVGDLAFFLLLRITGVPFEQMLPDSVRAKVREDGVYAYFRYTEIPANRAALQRKWKAWLKRQKSKFPQ